VITTDGTTRRIGPQKGVDGRLTAAGTLSTSIGGVEVIFNGVAAALVTVQSGQIVLHCAVRSGLRQPFSGFVGEFGCTYSM